MKYDKTILSTRFELLEKIDSFLTSCGWQTHRKDNETLYAKNHTGGGIVFHFIAFLAGYSSYSYAERSTIWVCDSIDENLAYNAQKGSAEISFFEFQQDNNKELGEVRLIGDDDNFTLQINCSSFPRDPFILVFNYGYLNKSHEFNGGTVAYSSIWRINDSGYFPQQAVYSATPFTRTTKTLMSLGGAWRDLYLADSRNSLIITNLTPANTNTASVGFNALSSLSVGDLLEIAKSILSGLFTLIKPLFYYKNHVGKFVYAGSLEKIRVVRNRGGFINGQILNLGDTKFMLIQLCSSCYYWLAVRID